MSFIFNPGTLGKYFGSNMSKLQVIPIDVVNSENLTRTFDITSKAVEDGSVISDNIIEQPITIRMDCIMKGTLFTSWKDKKAAIDQLASAREPFDVVSHFGTFTNMFFKEIPYVANAEFNNVLRFTCTLQQIPIVKSSTVEIPASAQKGEEGKKQRAPAQDKGKVQGNKVSKDAPASGKDGKRKESWLSSMTGIGR
ncbi:MAG: phage baseplate protein [Aeromonadaceae bacterium]